MQPIRSAPTSPNQSMSILASSPLWLLVSTMMGGEMQPRHSPNWLPELWNLTTLQNVMEEPDEWVLLIKNYNSDDDDDSD